MDFFGPLTRGTIRQMKRDIALFKLHSDVGKIAPVHCGLVVTDATSSWRLSMARIRSHPQNLTGRAPSMHDQA